MQSFDKVAAESLKNDIMHKEVSANEYASADEPGFAVHYLDIVILSALEVDTKFNVNVLVGGRRYNPRRDWRPSGHSRRFGVVNNCLPAFAWPHSLCGG